MAGVLPPWHDGCHGSPVWSAKCWLAGNGRRSAEGLAQGALPLDPGLRACGAQGRRGTCSLAGVLPPWHDGCHGSPVWSAKCWLAGNGRRSAEGLAQGALPLDPGLRACGAQGHRGLAGWPGFYRRGTTGATARRSGRRNAGWPVQTRKEQ